MDREYLAERTSEAFAQVIAKSVEIDPKKRFQNAFEMFLAFQNVGEEVGDIRRSFADGRAVRFGLLIGMAGCLAIGGYGIYRIRAERVTEYNRLVAQQEEYRENKEYDRQEEVFEEAVRILPTSLESYYQNACALFEQEALRRLYFLCGV